MKINTILILLSVLHSIEKLILTSFLTLEMIRTPEFANYFVFHHRKVAAEHALANGCVEAFMKPLRKCIQTAKTERKDWHQALVEFLRSFRSTPLPTTGLPPSTLMFGSNRTNLLPTIIKESKSREEYKK
jgi:hypothetical protein